MMMALEFLNNKKDTELDASSMQKYEISPPSPNILLHAEEREKN